MMKARNLRKLSFILMFVLVIQVFAPNVYAVADISSKHDTSFVNYLIEEEDVLIADGRTFDEIQTINASYGHKAVARLQMTGHVAMLIYVFLGVYVFIIGFVIYKKDYMK